MNARGNLPASLSTFVGRASEMAQVKHLLSSTRLITLTGAGGCGKSRLALEVARASCERYADGAWLIELAPFAEAGLLAERVLSVLDFHSDPKRPALDVLSEMLAEKQLLLLVDNCEHLVDASAMLAQTLLSKCPRLQLMATSREALNVPGEAVWRVPSLRFPDPRGDASVAAIAATEAADLFVQRARAVEPRFKLSSTNARAVGLICARLDGMPLAIELAAARVGVLPIGEILQRLDDRFALLTSGSRTAIPRQQTLRASMDWSYDLLNEKEQVVFRRLSVFAGGFGLDAVERVCSGQGIAGHEVLDITTGLLRKSMVTGDIERQHLGRFGLLETLRQYGRQKLAASGETTRTSRQHCSYFVDLAEAAGAGLRGSGQAAWLERLDQERDNLSAALGWSIDHDPEGALRIATSLSSFWYHRGYLQEGRTWLNSALAGNAGPRMARAEALLAAGNLALYQNDLTAAAALFDESLNISRQQHDRASEGEAHIHLGLLASQLGEFDHSRELLETGLDMCRDVQDAVGMGRALFALGMLSAVQGDLDQAQMFAAEGASLARASGDLTNANLHLMNLAVIAFMRGDRAGMRLLTQEGLIINRNLRSEMGLAFWLDLTAALASIEGHHKHALELLGSARARRQAAQGSLGSIWSGRVEEAVEPSVNALGKDVATIALQKGCELAFDEAVALALSDAGNDHDDQRQAIGAKVGPLELSRREQEIATLVAEGLTNRQIAKKLFIGKRTAETHVQHILNKLGFDRRAQIAAWAVRERLVADEPPRIK